MPPHVTVPAATPRAQYVASGGQTQFPYPFMVFKAADLQVFLGETVQNGGYSVQGAGTSDGGTVVFATPPAAGTLVTLRRRLGVARTTDFQEGGAFRAKLINDELDYLTAALQQMESDLARAVALAPTATMSRAPLLPPPVAGKAIGWSSDGTRLVNDPTDFTTTDAIVQQWATNASGALAQAQSAASTASGAASSASGHASSALTARQEAEAAATQAVQAMAQVETFSQQADTARVQAEAHVMDAVFTLHASRLDRAAAQDAAGAAATSAATAEARATEALLRIERSEDPLWRATRAARRAERASQTLPRPGIGPGDMLPNWARITTP